MSKRFALSALVLALAGAAFAESQRGTATVILNGKKVTIDYGRPALKGRSLADLVKQLPEDRIWRAGDDEVTTLTSELDLVIGGKEIPGGKYSVYVHLPADGSRNLVLNKDLGVPLKTIWAAAPADVASRPYPRLDGYQTHVSDQEILRQPMRKEALRTPTDLFTIGLSLVPKGGATLNFTWGDESWSVDVKSAR